MSVTIDLDVFGSTNPTHELLKSKLRSIPPVSYHIHGASFITLASDAWSVEIDQEIPQDHPRGLFTACQTLFNYYLELLNDHDALSPDMDNQSLWQNCLATNFYESLTKEMEKAFKDLDDLGVFTSEEKLSELEQEELNQPWRRCGNNEDGEGPYTCKVLAWLRHINGLEGGDQWGDHALVFKLHLKRISKDNHGNTIEHELIPIDGSCKYLKYR